MADEITDWVLCVMVKPGNAKSMRSTLFELDVTDKTKKAMKCGDVVAIPITLEAFKHLSVTSCDDYKHYLDEFTKCVCLSCTKQTDNVYIVQDKTCKCNQRKCSGNISGIDVHVVIIMEKTFKKKQISPSLKLEETLSKILSSKNIPVNDAIKKDFPNKWEVHEDLVLLPSQCLTNDIWKIMSVDDWQEVATSIGGMRLAHRICGIQRDGFRTPTVELLLGESGWVEHIDNGIRYSFDVTKCMFSSGNITEKIRVANMDCTGEIVVDLYAGIGYFTLPYLVHGNAAFVHACEWNPNAVEALKKNLVLNKVQDRCTIHEGDNRQTCPVGVADRVNLGLIPTSKEGWPVACRALKNIGGILHIHGNVTTQVLLDSVDVETTAPCASASKAEETPCFVANILEDKTMHVCGPDIGTSTNKNLEGETAHNKLGSHIICDNKNSRQPFWKKWSHEVSEQIKQLCIEFKGGDWSTQVLHIEKVKSYAPHIDHIVVDLECRPL